MPSPIDMLFEINPKYKTVPKMKQFIDKRYHITFEKADKMNSIKKLLRFVH